MEYDRDKYDRVELPNTISNLEDSATCALALKEFFEGKYWGEESTTLARLTNAVLTATVSRLEANSFNPNQQYGQRVTYIDGDGTPHTALIMEPGVASMGDEQCWDPHRNKYVNPAEAYPHGTVQLIYTPEFELGNGFNFDRKSDIEVATSVTPASSPDDVHCYSPGWDAA